jgi:chromate transport protein ChrA
MDTRTNPTRRLLFNALGLFFSVIPVAVSIFSYFPLWIAREDASILSGISLVLAAMALVPCFRYVKEAMRTASAPVMWLAIFIVFLLLSKIANEITVIAFVGFVGNLVGAVFFRLARDKGNDGRT